jgi:outer membrane protein assembly factor BamD (BamD/ComL family)
MEKALVKSAYIAYNVKKDYQNANILYEKLKSVASTRQNTQIAKIGLLNTSYGSKKYKETIQIADEIINDMELSEDIKRDAQYLKIKSMYLINETDNLINSINAYTEDKNSEKSAELTFLKARFLTNQKEFVSSNELLIKAKDDYASYEPWVIRYYILIAENYHKLGDDFQAKATLESIIQNYNGDKRLIEEAKLLLKEVVESANAAVGAPFEEHPLVLVVVLSSSVNERPYHLDS